MSNFNHPRSVQQDHSCRTSHFQDSERQFLAELFRDSHVILEYVGDEAGPLAIPYIQDHSYVVVTSIAGSGRVHQQLGYAGKTPLTWVYEAKLPSTSVTQEARPDHYVMRIWDEPSFQHPEVVIVNGKYKTACLMFAYLKATKPLKVVMQRSSGEKSSALISNQFQPHQVIGQFELYEVLPGTWSPANLSLFFESLLGAECGSYPDMISSKDSDVTIESLLKSKDYQIEEVRTELALAKTRYDSLKTHLEISIKELQKVLKAAKQEQSHVKELIKLVVSALAWQKRSFIKRWFSRWKINLQVGKKYSYLLEVDKELNAGKKVHEIHQKVVDDLPKLSEQLLNFADLLSLEISSSSPTDDSTNSAGEREEEDKFALVEAYKLSQNGLHDQAIELAKTKVLPKQLYTLELLKANKALASQDEVGWMRHVNEYLSHFNLAPVHLKVGNHILSRLSTNDLPRVTDGPLISVIMPAWNCEETIRAAANSILNQTWRNLELIIIDDCSSDSTWEEIQHILSLDSRVVAIRNSENLGPYASKNIALNHAKGEWITGHDSDDWAHPQRLERHIKCVLQEPILPRASLTYMVRLNSAGHLVTFSQKNAFAPDGATRIAAISCLFKRSFLCDKLGYWESVKFGGDSEMIKRAQKLLGHEFKYFFQIGMFCLSSDGGLTNHPKYGVDISTGTLSPVRENFVKSYQNWHKSASADELKISFPHINRPYELSNEIEVPAEKIKRVMDTSYVLRRAP